MKKFSFLILLLTACQHIEAPTDFVYRPIETTDFTLASWQKITDSAAPYKIYIEGDGHAFLRNGLPSNDPTPRGVLMRDLAFHDPAPNVVYLARPCQYIQGGICTQRHWTTARFAPEVIRAETEALRQTAKDSPLTLVGFSGGAQVAGLIAVTQKDLNIRQVVTIAGNLDHRAWTESYGLAPLNESLNLADYRNEFLKVPQVHYVGGRDDAISPALTRNFVADSAKIVEIKEAGHQTGWEKAYSAIWNE